MTPITNTEARDRIEAILNSAMPCRPGKRILHGQRMTITSGSFAQSSYGNCVTLAIVGGQTMKKSAINGKWTGWYSDGLLQHEEFAS